MKPKQLLLVCFFISGFASLVLEVVWAKEMSYLIGNSLYAISTVLAGFMGGLGLGSWLASRYAHRFSRPVLVYGWLEAGVAVFAFIALPLFRSSTPLFSLIYNQLGPGHPGFLLIRFIFVFVMLLVPTALMGMTLPVVVGALARGSSSYFKQAGWLYGLNTLGAVTGTALAGFLFIPRWGLLKTSCFAGLFGAGIFALSFYLDSRIHIPVDATPSHTEKKKDTTSAAPQWTPMMRWIAALFFISGMAAFLYEVAWFRVLVLVIGPSVYAFSAMLVAYLTGISLGSLIFTPYVEKLKKPVLAFSIMELMLGLITIVSLFFFNSLPRLYADIFGFFYAMGPVFYPMAQFTVSALIVLAPCLLMGAMFPVVIRIFREGNLGVEKSVGTLYLFNTMGGILGSILGGYLLIPYLGLRSSLVLTGFISVGIAAAAWIKHGHTSRTTRLGVPAMFLLAACLAAFFSPPIETLRLSLGLYRGLNQIDDFSLVQNDMLSVKTLLSHTEGLSASVIVEKAKDGAASLHISGKADASNLPEDMHTATFTGQLPMMFASNRETVALIGHGTGTTLHTILTHPDVEHVDMIELEQAVIDAWPYFRFINHNSLADPRVTLLVEDGRIHIKHTRQQYDVIISEPTNVWIAGVNNLFTKEYYEEVQSKLNPGGLFCQWFQLYESSPEALDVTLRTLTDVFSHVLLFQSGSADLFCLAGDELPEIPWSEFESRFNIPDVRSTFEIIGISKPYELLSFFVAGNDSIRTLSQKAPAINTDDNAWLEYHMPLEMYETFEVTPTQVLLDRFAGHRLRDLQVIFPDMNVEECASDNVRFWHAAELLFDSKNRFYDIWEPMRTRLLKQTHRELLEMDWDDFRKSISKLEINYRDGLQKRARALVLAQECLVLKQQGAEPELFNQKLNLSYRLAPDAPFTLLLLGVEAFEGGRFDVAEALFERITQTPGSTHRYDGFLGLANVALIQKDVEKALEYCDLALAINPYLSLAFDLKLELLDDGSPEYRESLREARFHHPENEAYQKLADAL